jgi:monofunctional chorismate mutase
MAQPRPSTSRYSKPSPNVSTTVCRPFTHLTLCLRIHYSPLCGPLGKFVSESKFSQDPAAFIPHIQKGDTEALAALITKPEVERRLLVRLRKKAMLYAQDFASDGEPLPNCTNKGKIDVDCVVDLYESYIIPLTKEIEVSGHLAVIFQQLISVLG